ncbi:hypothetical protein D2E22_2008 [Bifidobacterium castoris]|uniref:Uncharacterized protein n=1 Tax=Bifidobacterium castoris TaxID=2306972 RepID=A0A430F493_9BIFI|nr:hypothetical protein D2E22_2008 [Bifidobacterium castoris]
MAQVPSHYNVGNLNECVQYEGIHIWATQLYLT